jgi:hypothetical protein
LSIDEQHVALPKLYGAPAYGRPRRAVDVTPRPLDPDDLPIAAYQTDEERELAERLPHEGATAARDGSGELKARPFRLRALVSRILPGN